jgi:CPA1 family monovalent cation:H+ antiporter
MPSDLLALELTFVELLLLVFVVAMVVHRIRLPYTVALVLVGLGLSFQNVIHFELTPEIILMLFLPPLVFEAALHIDYGIFRKVATPVLLLAIFGVLITIAVIWGLLTATGLLDWQTALIFAALIAATDPVAVVSLFKALGAPKRLSTLVESESLFNDATTIVVFHIVVGAVLMGDGAFHLNWTHALLRFATVAFGGISIGVASGIVANFIFARVDDHLIEITLSTIVAYGAYLLAEQFHLSGVLAVVFAGMLIGNRSSRNMSPTTRMMLANFWEYIAFLVNSLVFILIGMQVVVPRFGNQVYVLIFVVVVVVLISRAVTVYGLSFISKLLGSKVKMSYQHVLFWGGLRGAVSLALALSLSRSVPNRDLILTLTFAVVLFTLLVQATTIGPLLRRLGLAGQSETEKEYERIHARLLAARAAYNRMKGQYAVGVIDPTAWQKVEQDLKARIRDLSEEQRAFAEANPDLVARITSSLQRESLLIQRAHISDLEREGMISDDVARELIEEIDAILDELRRPEENHPEAVSEPSAVDHNNQPVSSQTKKFEVKL